MGGARHSEFRNSGFEIEVLSFKFRVAFVEFRFSDREKSVASPRVPCSTARTRSQISGSGFVFRIS